ncbi:MAG: hypothetical protein HQL67_03890 [Magnetococcales bacterium]|nr:hypothetical protein [Magnetococcales bacterium]
MNLLNGKMILSAAVGRFWLVFFSFFWLLSAPVHGQESDIFISGGWMEPIPTPPPLRRGDRPQPRFEQRISQAIASEDEREKTTIYEKLMERQPFLKEWVSPYILSEQSKEKEVGIQWNPDRPQEAAVQIRPFHRVQESSSSLSKLELRGRLFGEGGDLEACYPLSSQTSAQLIQRNGSAAFQLNFSRHF